MCTSEKRPEALYVPTKYYVDEFMYAIDRDGLKVGKISFGSRRRKKVSRNNF